MNSDVVVVGSAHMDLIARAPRLPKAGESFLGSGYRCVPGGKAANQAIAAAQQGASAALVARVGSDPFGQLVHGALVRKGVDVAHLGADASAPTGLCPVLMAENGDYASIIVPGAGAALAREDIERAAGAISSCRVLIVQNETAIDVSAHAAHLARASGALVVANIAPAMTVDEGAKLSIWSSVDLLVVNQAEAETLSGAPVSDVESAWSAASALRNVHAVSAVIVTLGPNGAALVSPAGLGHVEGHFVPRVVDTIGAGDAFTGALAAAIARGEPLDLAARCAVAAGAIAVQREGAYDACPTRDEVTRLIGHSPI